MKIEVGKAYRRRDGKVYRVKTVDPEASESVRVFAIEVNGNGCDHYCIDGRYYSSGGDHLNDLVEEVADEQAVEPLDLRPGGVRISDNLLSTPPATSATEQLLQALASAARDVEAAAANRRAAEQALAAAIEHEQDVGARYEDARRELDRNVARLSARRQ